MVSKKTMELNPSHIIVKTLKDRIGKDSTDQTTRDLVLMLFDTSLLVSGFAIDDPTSYSNRIHRMIKLAITDDVEDDEGDAGPAPAAPEVDQSQVTAMEDVD